MSFAFAAIDPATLDRVRSAGADDFGHPLAPRTYDDGGYPLRCCLRLSEPGERLALIAHRPFPWDGPYAEVGPVFIHAEDCPGYVDGDRYPPDFRDRSQIYRAYGHDRTIVDAEIADAVDAEPVIEKLLSRPEVDFVHCRNVAYGCFMFTIRRTSPARDRRSADT